ncbi:hypothetical protein [Brachybacterium sp. UNK5269]|uniref:hypothetical protein n=1 Tax=Brachybacterium sp. UNK5269 TaxID=3408576 RepID=UPI003BAE6DCE
MSRELEVSLDLQKDPEPLQMLGDDAVRRLNNEVDQYRKAIRAIKDRHANYAPLSKVTDTDRIRHASRMVASGDEAANIRAALLSAWRHSSGHAHGLTWTRTRKVVGIEREGPHWRGLAQPDLEQISLLAIGTAMVGIKALDRVRELSIGPGAMTFGYKSPVPAF